MARLCVVALASIAVLAVGCGKTSQEEIAERQIEEALGGKAEVPKDFPKDVFLYSPSKQVMTMKMPGGFSIALSTNDAKTKIVEAYKREMKAKGWTEHTVIDAGQDWIGVYEKDKRSVNISVTPGDEGTIQIGVMVTTP